MGKVLKEYFLFILVCGLASLFGFALIIYVFAADTIRTEIVRASSIRSVSYEVERNRSKDDPDYDPITNKTKTTHSEKYFRTVTVEVDGELADLELSSDFKFMLPGEGRKITVSRYFDDGYEWEHPIRNLIMGIVLGLGGLAAIIAIFRFGPVEKKSSKKKSTKRKHKKK